MRKHDIITYTTSIGMRVQAIVRRMHRDGTVTIEERFVLHGGKPVGTYLGHRRRIDQQRLRPR